MLYHTNAMCLKAHNTVHLQILIDWYYSALHFNITPQALPCLDWPRGNVVCPIFLAGVAHALKNQMKY